MILPIKNTEDWGLIRQKNQMQINKDNICKNNKIVCYGYKVGDNAVLDQWHSHITNEFDKY